MWRLLMESRYLRGQDNIQPILAVTVILYSTASDFHACMLHMWGPHRNSWFWFTEKKNNNKKTSLWPSTGSILYILRLEEIGATPRVTLPKYKPKLQGIPNKGKDCRCCCSVAQWYPTLSNPMDCSTPGFPVHHQLPEFVQTHVHRVGDAIQPSHLLSSPSPPAFNLSQHQGLFQWVSSSHQVAKALEFQHQPLQWIFRTDFL